MRSWLPSQSSPWTLIATAAGLLALVAGALASLFVLSPLTDGGRLGESMVGPAAVAILSAPLLALLGLALAFAGFFNGERRPALTAAVTCLLATAPSLAWSAYLVVRILSGPGCD